MSAQTVITHALKQGARRRYTGTQAWGHRVVTVVKPWGGRKNPLYVVAPDGVRGTYVVSESELTSLGDGVTLGKASDTVGTQAISPRREAMTGVSHFPGWDDGEECAWTPEACHRNYQGVCPQHHATR